MDSAYYSIVSLENPIDEPNKSDNTGPEKKQSWTWRSFVTMVSIPLLLFSISCSLVTLLCMTGWVWVEDQQMCYIITNRQHRII